MQNKNEIEEEIPKGVILRDFDDFTTLRGQIFEGVKNSMIKAFPVKYGNVRVEVHDVDYDELDDVPVSQQKKMLLENKYITKKLRGTIKLFDDTNDQLLEEKRVSLMRVPYLTNRGTFIHGGNEYASIMQSRLLPGVYTRRQANGELETQFNVKPGTGIGFRVGFEPETTQYRVKISQANLHLYSLLKDIGTSDEELEKAWGPDIFRANKMKYDVRVFDKAYDRLVSAKQKKADKTKEDKVASLKKAFDAAQIHARVAQKNLPNMFDPKVAAEWEARWQGKQAMQKLAAESIDSIPFEPDLTAKEAVESFIDDSVLESIENEKSASVNSRKAIIIKGNPTYIKDNADADKFYSQIEALLKELGYDVGFDAGEPHTVPDEDADLWIGHSRGADRLRFAPSKTRTVRLDDYEPKEYTNAQEKEYARLFKELGVSRVMDIPEDKRPKPGKEHYTFNEAMQEAVKSAADMRSLMQARRHSAQAKLEYKKKTDIMSAALARYPEEFIVEQDGRMSGIVHLPTGFRIHVPREVIPANVKRIFQEVEDDD